MPSLRLHFMSWLSTADQMPHASWLLHVRIVWDLFRTTFGTPARSLLGTISQGHSRRPVAVTLPRASSCICGEMPSVLKFLVSYVPVAQLARAPPRSGVGPLCKS